MSLIRPNNNNANGEPSINIHAAAAAPTIRRVEPVGRAFQRTLHPSQIDSSSVKQNEIDAEAAASLRDAKYERYKTF